MNQRDNQSPSSYSRNGMSYNSYLSSRHSPLPKVPKKPNKKPLIAAVAFLILGIGGWLTYANTQTGKEVATSTTPPTSAAATESRKDNTIRLIASGDMLPHDTVNLRAKQPDGSYDYKQFFDNVKPVFQSADINFCNHEVTSAGEAFGISGYPVFNAPKTFTSDLASIGCNIFNLANNHINDKGQSGIDATISNIESIDGILAYTGANRSSEEQNRVRYFEVQGTTFAFLGFSELSNNRELTLYGLNQLDESLVTSLVSEARSKADVVLVSAHWGTEYDPEASQLQQRWAQKFADLGADVVIGTGPHVLQPVQKLAGPDGRETMVWYSLGNMLSTQEDVESLIGGFAVMDFTLSDGRISIKQLKFMPTYMHYEWTPAEKARGDLLARKNLMIYPLDKSAGPLARSPHQTSVEAQVKRINSILNKYIEVKLVTLNDLR